MKIMKTRKSLRLFSLALGFAVLLGTSASVHAQLYYVWSNPWGPTYHDLSFTSVSNVQDVNWTWYSYFGGQVTTKVGFSFVGTTSSGQSYTVQVLGPGGNIIAPRVGAAEMRMTESMVKAFRDNPQYYTALRLFHVEKYVYTPYSVTTSSKMKIEVSSPAPATDSDLNGGLIELTVNCGGDFYAEAKIRRSNSCGATYRRSRIGVLRNARQFIKNRDTTFTTLNPASPTTAEDLVATAVDGVPFLDVSGATKLEDNDPYHLSGNDSCLGSTYIIDDYPFLQING